MVLFNNVNESLWYISSNIYLIISSSHLILVVFQDIYIYTIIFIISTFDDIAFTQSYLVKISLLMWIDCIISYLYVACKCQINKTMFLIISQLIIFTAEHCDYYSIYFGAYISFVLNWVNLIFLYYL